MDDLLSAALFESGLEDVLSTSLPLTSYQQYGGTEYADTLSNVPSTSAQFSLGREAFSPSATTSYPNTPSASDALSPEIHGISIRESYGFTQQFSHEASSRSTTPCHSATLLDGNFGSEFPWTSSMDAASIASGGDTVASPRVLFETNSRPSSRSSTATSYSTKDFDQNVADTSVATVKLPVATLQPKPLPMLRLNKLTGKYQIEPSVVNNTVKIQSSKIVGRKIMIPISATRPTLPVQQGRIFKSISGKSVIVRSGPSKNPIAFTPGVQQIKLISAAGPSGSKVFGSPIRISSTGGDVSNMHKSQSSKSAFVAAPQPVASNFPRGASFAMGIDPFASHQIPRPSGNFEQQSLNVPEPSLSPSASSFDSEDMSDNNSNPGGIIIGRHVLGEMAAAGVPPLSPEIVRLASTNEPIGGRRSAIQSIRSQETGQFLPLSVEKAINDSRRTLLATAGFGHPFVATSVAASPRALKGSKPPPPSTPTTGSKPSTSMTGSKPISTTGSKQKDQTVIPQELEDEEEVGHTDTYAEYKPAKLRIGERHPDPVIETSSLSSVLPPDNSYILSIPEEIIDEGRLSALQLEAIVYACQRQETFLPNGERAGYLIGDGAGVGKGRTIAGIINENYLLGRKRAIWFSVSTDLKYDAERDLADIGAGRIKVNALNKFRYAKISGSENGKVKKGVIFATYSSLIGESHSAKGKYRSRLRQLTHWCGKDFDGVIVFDECHRAKNLLPSTSGGKPSKTGKTVVELQKLLPKARVIYASATGATEPRNMAYMTRLGLWGEGMPFREFSDFIAAVERRGVGAMEIVAMDMKLRGMYLARQLSFHGVSFKVVEVSLTRDFIRSFDDCVNLWLEAREKFQLAADMIGLDSTARKGMWAQFWSAHQRFFKYLCIASKVDTCVRMAREAVKAGKCVVIGLQSTGEARTLEQIDDMNGELTDFISTAKGVFQALVEKHFPVSNYSVVQKSTFVPPPPPKNPIIGIITDPEIMEARRKAKQEARLARKRQFRETSDTSGSSDNDVESDSDDVSSSDSNSEKAVSGDEMDDINPFLDDEDIWSRRAKVEKSPPQSTSAEPAKKKKKMKKQKKIKKRPRLDPPDFDQQSESDAGDSDDEMLIREGESLEQFQNFARNFSGAQAGAMGHFSEFELNQTGVMRAELLSRLDCLEDGLPANTLDQLIDLLGGPDMVAEMTGRKGRVVTRENGDVQYELRHEGDVPLEMLNIAEKERFMRGQKFIAIISEAASSGISLQADRRAQNRRRRVHITLELPWSADKAIQQFGRTHRSNQVSAPEYVFLISELAGEKRFASIVAKRLESLGALTHGDRRATESRDLSQFNLDTKFGRIALESTMKSIIGSIEPLVPQPADYVGDFFKELQDYLSGVGLLSRDSVTGGVVAEKDAYQMAKFLNRILGLPVHAQNALFQFFSDTLKEVINQAKRDGRYDLGILDLGAGSENVRKVQSHVFLGKYNSNGLDGVLKVELHTVKVERGMSWQEAIDVFCSHTKDHDGFYKSLGLKPSAILVTAVNKRRLESSEQLFNVYRPNTGLNAYKLESLPEIKRRYIQVPAKDVEEIWHAQYDSSKSMCQHQLWYGRCRNQLAGLTCEAGQRERTFHVLSGSVLNVWQVVEGVLNLMPNKRQQRMQVIRMKTVSDQKIIGLVIPKSSVLQLVDRLTELSVRTYIEQH